MNRPDAIATWDRDQTRVELLEYAAKVAAGDLPAQMVRDSLLPLIVPEHIDIRIARTCFDRLVVAIKHGGPTGEWLARITGRVEA